MTPRLSIIVASSGRPSLAACLANIGAQLKSGDQLLADVNQDGDWGHTARNRTMPLATGTHLLFADDDDVYVAGALDVIRAAVAVEPDRIHIFRMRYPDGSMIWKERVLIDGNVSTQMFCTPNVPALLGRWGEGMYAGDWEFIRTCLHSRPHVFHEDVIVLYAHHPEARG